MTTPVRRNGPLPVRDDAPHGAALELLRVLAQASGPLTIADLQSELGGHQNRFRLPLEQLVTAGFASETTVAATGRGRPARAYVASATGAQVALEEPGRHVHAALVEAVTESLRADPDRSATARALGVSWGSHLPGMSMRDALAAQGFAPAVEADRILLRTCPLLDVAQRHPDVVCSMHQGMVDAIAGPGLTLVPFAEPGGCLIRWPSDTSQRRELS